MKNKLQLVPLDPAEQEAHDGAVYAFFVDNSALEKWKCPRLFQHAVIDRKELETYWCDLSGSDASNACRAIWALVDAPSTDNNSLYVNIDAPPADPTMIWDIPVTTGLTSQTVSWRGNGTVSTNNPSGMTAQYAPKVFSLSAGTHQLTVRGREGQVQLGTITIAPSNLPAN